MAKTKSGRIVLAGLFTALGLVLPYFTAHMFALPGTVLLPMHIPVLLAGLVCGPLLGGLCGLVIPVLSSMLTGMPAAWPMLPIMVVQLAVMGTLSGLLHTRLRWNVYLALVASMAAGWAAYGLVFALLALAGGGALRALTVGAALAAGIPGIAVQLVLLPPVAALLKRAAGAQGRAAGVRKTEAPSGAQAQALALLKSGEATCIVIQDGAIVYTGSGRGVSPLLRLYRSEPEKLADALVVDKIIGKAAAMILVLGGASRAYGAVMSVAAARYLAQQGIAVEYGRCVDLISNRDQTGICPIERSVLDTDDPQEGLERITATIDVLMSGKSDASVG